MIFIKNSAFGQNEKIFQVMTGGTTLQECGSKQSIRGQNEKSVILPWSYLILNRFIWLLQF